MFLIILVGAAIVAFFIVALSRRDDTPNQGCASETVTAVDTDRSADEALAVFVAEHEEGPIPLTGWTKTSEAGSTTTFTSNEQGHWQIIVRNGAVRSYDGCRD
jgi:hypothetical protein